MKSSDLWVEKQWQRSRKCSVVSTSVPHGRRVFTVSLKPCLKLCSFKWVNWSLNRDNNFTPIGSWTLYKVFSRFAVIIDFLNLYIDFAYLTSGLSLFHSSIQYAKNVLLKFFVLDGIHFNLPDDTDLILRKILYRNEGNLVVFYLLSCKRK